MSTLSTSKKVSSVTREILPLLAIIYAVLDIARINYNTTVPISGFLYLIGFILALLYIPRDSNDDTASRKNLSWVFSLIPIMCFIVILNSLKSGIIVGSFAAILYIIIIQEINREKK